MGGVRQRCALVDVVALAACLLRVLSCPDCSVKKDVRLSHYSTKYQRYRTAATAFFAFKITPCYRSYSVDQKRRTCGFGRGAGERLQDIDWIRFSSTHAQSSPLQRRIRFLFFERLTRGSVFEFAETMSHRPRGVAESAAQTAKRGQDTVKQTYTPTHHSCIQLYRHPVFPHA